ncbi:MAG TPA: TlpA disulfide reductase family protein [Ktedonobacterales bacterium]|jgi:peroxiredoxin|nr:TlpA disulfide reductase family protein [Ktedonobacterales bacterium]
MIESFRAHMPKSLPTASQALRGGMLASALLAVVLLIAFRATAPSPTATQRRINQPATAFTLPAEQAGARLPVPATFAPATGKPTLLVFFYTLCTHCLLQMQSTHAVTTGFRDLHTVYIDSPSELPNLPDLMMQRLGITDPVLLDADGRVAARYGIAYYPSLVLIDGRGIVRAIWTGETDAATLHAGIARALATNGNGSG